jgi:precorrin-2 methylase
MPGILYVVATPIGNLEDVTLRALRVLREVAVIAAEDTRRTARLLQHYSISTRTTSLHEHNERARTPALVARLQAGESVAHRVGRRHAARVRPGTAPGRGRACRRDPGGAGPGPDRGHGRLVGVGATGR